MKFNIDREKIYDNSYHSYKLIGKDILRSEGVPPQPTKNTETKMNSETRIIYNEIKNANLKKHTKNIQKNKHILRIYLAELSMSAQHNEISNINEEIIGVMMRNFIDKVDIELLAVKLANIEKESLCFHPGSYIKDILEDRDLTIEEFVSESELPLEEDTVKDLIKERIDVNKEVAIKLESATNITKNTWLNLQIKYDKCMLEIDRGEAPSAKPFERLN